jgi:hypothetical protein
VRTTVDLSDSTDVALNIRSVSLFGYKKALEGVYVVAKLRGGFLVGESGDLWRELLAHPFRVRYEADANFTASAIWFNLDEG